MIHPLTPAPSRLTPSSKLWLGLALALALLAPRPGQALAGDCGLKLDPAFPRLLESLQTPHKAAQGATITVKGKVGPNASLVKAGIHDHHSGLFYLSEAVAPGPDGTFSAALSLKDVPAGRHHFVVVAINQKGGKQSTFFYDKPVAYLNYSLHPQDLQGQKLGEPLKTCHGLDHIQID